MGSQKHSLIRTSPKGGPFLGTCTGCGADNLPMKAATEDCPGNPAITPEEALLTALRGPQQ